MKIKLLFFFLMVLVSQFAHTQDVNRVIKDGENGQKMLYGVITEKALLKEPFSEWYGPVSHAYIPDTKTIMNLIENHADVYRYYIVLGTWCPDSRREVPAMMKVLKDIGVHEDNINLIAVDRKKKVKNMKLRKMKISRVPTLIVMAGEHEIGRIVETPDLSIEEDLEKILVDN